MCDEKCGGCSACIPVGPPGPPGIPGTPGRNGNDGRGELAHFVSDGVTPIGDVIYPVNTLVVQYTDLTYQSAGVINIPVPATIQWQDMTLANGWANGVGVLKAQYAIFGGFLHLRGRIDFSSATNDNFATIPGTGITGTIYTSGATDHAGADIELDQEALITIDNAGAISALGATSTLDGSRLILDSIPPISIR